MKKNSSLNRMEASLSLGVSVRTVHNLVLRGRLRQLPDGHFQKKELDRYRACQNRNNQGLKAELDLHLKELKAKREEFLFKKLTGELVPVQSVYAVWTPRLAELIKSLWTWPQTLPSLLEGKTRKEMADIFEHEAKLIMDRHNRDGKWTPKETPSV